MTIWEVMTMMQAELLAGGESSVGQPRVSPSGFNQSSRSHVLVHTAAQRGRLERNDSGRMAICEDTDIPDLLDLTEWRGR
jgi:hypothetical protein